MKFTPDDFSAVYGTEYPDGMDIKGICAHIANAKLEQWLAEALTIYGVKNPKNNIFLFGINFSEIATHKAKIVCIEELERGK